jgi:plastocyanin
MGKAGEEETMRRWITSMAVSILAAATLIPAASPAVAATMRVKANDNVFRPRTITVERGTRVRWVNRGSNPHTTTGKSWDKDIPVGGAASKVFKKRGTFRYVCTIHVDLGMRGKVVVV